MPGDGTVVADVEASIDSARTAIIAFSVLRKALIGRMNAYFGAGVGRTVVVVRDVRFRADYRSDSPAQFDPPLSFYDSHQDENLADRTNALLLHVGADYPLTERLSFGARLTYSHIGDIADRGFYIRHPMEEQVSTACPHFVLVPPASPTRTSSMPPTVCSCRPPSGTAFAVVSPIRASQVRRDDILNRCQLREGEP